MGSVFSCFGLRFGARTNSLEVWPQIVERLPLGSRPLDGRTAPCVYSIWAEPPSRWKGVRSMRLLYRNSARLARSLDLEDILDRLESDLRAVAAAWSPRCTFLRADGVRVGKGALVIASNDPRHRDPLVSELFRLGGESFADEFAPLVGGGLVPCVPRRSLDEQPGLSPSELLPIALVVFPARHATGPPRLERLSRAIATVELVASAQSREGTAEAQLATLTELARRATVVRLSYSDPAPAAAAVLQLLAESDSAR